jgi:hypothetical protein
MILNMDKIQFENRAEIGAIISSARLTLQKTCEIQQTLFFATCVPG